MSFLNSLFTPSNFAASPAGWNPYSTFTPQLSGASSFPTIARAGSGLLGGLTEPVVNSGVTSGFSFPSLIAGNSGAQTLGLAGGPPGILSAGQRLAGQATNAPGGFLNSLSAVEGGGAGGGLTGVLEGAGAKGAVGGAEAAASTGLLKGLLTKPGVKGGLYGVGAQLLANQFLAPGLRQMLEQGGTQENVGQFGLGAIKSLPVAVGTGMAIGGPLGAAAGAGIGIAAGVADAVFDFDKAKPKAPEAMDTFLQAVASDPTWTMDDKNALLSQISLAKASGADNGSIIQSLVLPSVQQHVAQVQQYQQNQQQMEAQQKNLAAQSSAIGQAAMPILGLLEHNAEEGFNYRQAALNTKGVSPAYAAITNDLAAQQRDTQKLMAASLYQQALAAPYQNYYNAINNQTQALQQLGGQVQSGYIQQAAQKFLDQQKGSTQDVLSQILQGG